MVGEESAQGYQEEEKSPFKKILGINFVIFVVYYVIALLMLRTQFDDSAFFFIFLYPLQVAFNFIAGVVFIFKKDSKKSSAFFLAGFIILIVGFGSCFLAITGVL